MNQTINIHIDIPPEVSQILGTLRAHGFEAYVVGGCVRDALLGRIPGDWDITTSALPQEVKTVFPYTVDTGIQHGTVMVLKNGSGYEVTTYRIDGEYRDSRHPENVTFTRSLEEDLKRRDFTINAFAWGDDGMIDLFDGLEDLKQGIIRCVGDPDQRFQEDALRIMRAIRFSAQLGFRIEERTGQMIRKHAPRLKDISMERIRTEWEKTLLSDHPDYVNMYANYEISPYIIRPGYERCFLHERDSVLKVLNVRRKSSEPDNMETGSPEICCQESDYPGSSHPDGAPLCDARIYRTLMIAAFLMELTDEEADQALRYLKYDNKTRDAVVKVLHYRKIPLYADRLYVKQAMNRMGSETWISVLELADAMRLADDPNASSSDENLPETEPDGPDRTRVQASPSQMLCLTGDILASGEPWDISQLAVNGSDLISAGIPAGKKIGEILEKILQKVMQSPTLNRRELLCDIQFLKEVEHECKRGV